MYKLDDWLRVMAPPPLQLGLPDQTFKRVAVDLARMQARTNAPTNAQTPEQMHARTHTRTHAHTHTHTRTAPLQHFYHAFEEFDYLNLSFSQHEV